MHVRDDTSKGQTIGTLMATFMDREAVPINLVTIYSYYYLSPTSYDYNNTRIMIQITYRQKGRKIGGA